MALLDIINSQELYARKSRHENGGNLTFEKTHLRVEHINGLLICSTIVSRPYLQGCDCHLLHYHQKSLPMMQTISMVWWGRRDGWTCSFRTWGPYSLLTPDDGLSSSWFARRDFLTLHCCWGLRLIVTQWKYERDGNGSIKGSTPYRPWTHVSQSLKKTLRSCSFMNRFAPATNHHKFRNWSHL